jgi:hypothetical protein
MHSEILMYISRTKKFRMKRRVSSLIQSITRLLKLAVGSLLNEVDVNRSNCSIESKYESVSLSSLANKLESFDRVLVTVDALMKEIGTNFY